MAKKSPKKNRKQRFKFPRPSGSLSGGSGAKPTKYVLSFDMTTGLPQATALTPAEQAVSEQVMREAADRGEDLDHHALMARVRERAARG